jgi:ABC-type amino acid transport substrate-binding protein
MAWTPFSAEAIALHIAVGKLDRDGRVSDALSLINAALEKAHRDGPSNTTYEQFEAQCNTALDDAGEGVPWE